MKSMPDGGGDGEEVVEKSARQRLESTESKNGSKLNGNDSGRSGKHLKMISNWSRSSNKKRRRASSVSLGSSSEEEDMDWSTSVGPSSDSDDEDVRKSRKRRKSAHKKSGLRSSDESSSDDSSSESEDLSRKHKSSGSRGKKSGRRKERKGRKVKSKEKRSHRSGNSRDRDMESVSKKTKDRTKSRDKVESRHKKDRRSKHRKEDGKKNSKDKVEEVAPSPQEDFIISKISRTPLQEKMDAQEKQKALIRHNAEMAKARLASEDMQRAREEQAEMQRLYGAVDWRARKKLRSEKKRLERTIAAGNKLANIEEREIARMDAFRVALGLPTAEAQRQAEWRAEATRALAEQEATMRETTASLLSAKPIKHSVIGPRLPH